MQRAKGIKTFVLEGNIVWKGEREREGGTNGWKDGWVAVEQIFI